MDILFWMQFAVVMLCIAFGGRLGGVGLGAAGGLGVCILVLIFGLKPGSPPIGVLLIITAVIACTSVLQGAGGLDYLVKIAEKLLRKKPNLIVFIGPLVCATFVIFCGTSYVAFAIYPVIAEVAADAKIRPERALSASVIAAGVGVIASPVSAAMAAMVGILAASGVSLFNILSISFPAYIIGILCACLSVSKRGKELEDDPEFQRRVASGEYQLLHPEAQNAKKEYVPTKIEKVSVLLFGIGVALVILLGSVKSLLPSWNVGGEDVPLPIPSLIQMVMLATAFFIIVFCKVPNNKFASGSVFRSGLIGVVGVFGVSWMTGTFFDNYDAFFREFFKEMVGSTPLLFGIILFGFVTVIFSPAATVTALMPLGLSIGIPPGTLIALLPCCADFFIPGAGQIGCVSFDRTGTTKLGSFVINHSYLRPGLVLLVSATTAGYLISKIVL